MVEVPSSATAGSSHCTLTGEFLSYRVSHVRAPSPATGSVLSAGTLCDVSTATVPSAPYVVAIQKH